MAAKAIFSNFAIARARAQTKAESKRSRPRARQKCKFYCLSPCARDGEVTKNSLSRHEHRTDINAEFRSLSIMVLVLWLLIPILMIKNLRKINESTGLARGVHDNKRLGLL